ncbi:MAG: malto-oligosyltrehalose trehalohydrolase [Acidobacteria bacterium]|nr:malto-oligosyltrehalose trehalohydrolase [Acidobacteriota bacterium]
MINSVLEVARGLPVGAELLKGGGVHFRLWAPRRKKVSVVLEGEASNRFENPREIPLTAEGRGYFSGLVSEAAAGTLYRFRLDGEARLLPDPVSRFQPEGVHGPSQIVDPWQFPWTDHNWSGVQLRGQVLYEMHIGTFTPEGTFKAAAKQLHELAELGITTVQVMPVAEFPGRFGWGYDGVFPFAPTRLYGRPDDFRHFVEEAHRCALGVILDVVYNHLGPDGNYLKEFSEDYFTDRYTTDWGEAINFDGESCGPVREFFLANVAYWIREFHLDGFRMDATHSIHDQSDPHIPAAISRHAHEAAGKRSIMIIAENEPQDTSLVRPLNEGGFGLGALYNEDFHHAARVALTGKREAYLTDYRGNPQELISAVRHGFLFQGQFYAWQMQRRGSPALDIPAQHFVTFLENHDQIANSGSGRRLNQLSHPGRLRALTALLLVAPQTPLLFQSQEFASSKPFAYFTDHRKELARLVRKGRLEFLSQFPSLVDLEAQWKIPDPSDRKTFEACKIDFAERELHSSAYRLHRDLLRLRREDPVFQAQLSSRIDGAVLARDAFVLRFFGEQGDDRLLVVNLGIDLDLTPSPEPLLAPPRSRHWQILWSSEDVAYGGVGTPSIEFLGRWRFPACSAVLMTSVGEGRALP